MTKLLVDITYTDSTHKFWFESGVKNKIFKLENGKNIHNFIAEICEQDGMELTYNGKPKGNVFIDTESGETKRIGYMYRGKTEIYDTSFVKPKTAFFNVWVTLKKIVNFEIDEID